MKQKVLLNISSVNPPNPNLNPDPPKEGSMTQKKDESLVHMHLHLCTKSCSWIIRKPHNMHTDNQEFTVI
jgi:hypothetical protein